MLKNLWYVAQRSSNITERPLKVRLIGQDFVLFRDRGGVARLLSDICIHRGGSLSGGLVVDGDVECPYHGWRFGGDGRCTKIPAQPDARIPERARVDSYPTIERHGWVWVFLGDLPEAERPPLPDLSWVGDPEFRVIWGHYDWAPGINWERVIENGLDFAHAPFVHGTAFGDRNRPEMADFEVATHDWGGDAKMVMYPPPPKGFWSMFSSARERREVAAIPGYHLSGPCVTLLLRPRADWKMNLVSAHTPIDDQHVRSWWIMGRNFMKSGFFDKDSARRNDRIFEQDNAVLQKLKPEHVPDSWREEVTVKSDALQVAFRRRLRELEARGWKLDEDRIAREFRGKRACTIPCPARRESPAWVLENVPMIPASTPSAPDTSSVT